MRFPPAAAAALLSTTLTLTVLELGARRWSDPTEGNAEIVALGADARAMSAVMASPDPEILYVTRPNYTRDEVRISDVNGVLRSDDVTVAKPAGTWRAAVVGDSIAAGHPLRLGDTPPFPLQLEQRLRGRRSTAGAEVLTFAADGYSTQQEARLLETEVARFSPDLVIVAYCLNDPSNSYTPTVWFLDDPAPRSYLLDFVRRRLALTPSQLSPAHPRYTHGAIDWDVLYRPDGPGWQGVEHGLTRIAAFAEGRKIPVLFVLFPLLTTGSEPPADQAQLQRIYGQLRAAAVARRFHFLDLGEVYRNQPASAIRFLPGDPIHPGALGHTLAADAILHSLDAARLLPE